VKYAALGVFACFGQSSCEAQPLGPRPMQLDDIQGGVLGREAPKLFPIVRGAEGLQR
jgi:hypothetical protein